MLLGLAQATIPYDEIRFDVLNKATRDSEFNLYKALRMADNIFAEDNTAHAISIAAVVIGFVP